MDSGFEYDWELRGAAKSALDERTMPAAELFSRR
jgi:hypothetical protein